MEERYHEEISVEMLVQMTLGGQDNIPAAVSTSVEPSKTDQSIATKALSVPLHLDIPQ